MLQLSSARQLPSNDAGDAVFMNVAAKSIFQSITDGTGDATLSSVMVADKSQARSGHQYKIAFADGGATFQMFDLTSDPGRLAPVASGAYTSGEAIKAVGPELNISGMPPTAIRSQSRQCAIRACSRGSTT